MKVNNWDRWQTYRSDRSTPPWIKVYRNLMSNQEWAFLSDSEKGQLVSIWILAADKKGEIPDCAKTIQKMCMLDKEPNINKFIELGFMTSTCQPDGCQHDAKVTHQTRLDKTRLEETSDKTINKSSPKPVNDVPYQKILNLYHELLPTLPKVEKLTATRKAQIRQRWLQDLKELDHWENFFDYVKQSKFLMGMTPPNNGHKPFKANLEWLTKESNFVKISEDNYHG